MAKRKYTDKQLIDAVRRSKSYRQVLNRIELKEAGGNDATIKRRINELGLDISRMTGQVWNRGIDWTPRVALEEYLNNHRPIQTFKL
jgi:hypothetical protein